MSTGAGVKHPLILWAQRSPTLYLSIEVGDLKIDDLVFEEDKFKIKGKKGDDKYEAELEFFGKLKGAERRKVETDRRVEFIIPKESEEWWPRLLKDKTKVPWIKIDFDKWKDEDEEKESEDAALGGMDFSSFGLPGGGKGFGDMGDLDMGGGDDDLDDMGDLEDVDEDEAKKPEENGGEPTSSTKEGSKAEGSTAVE